MASTFRWRVLQLWGLPHVPRVNVSWHQIGRVFAGMHVLLRGGVRGMEKRGHFDGLPSTPHRNVMRGRDTWKTNLFNLPSALVPLSADQAPWWCEGYIVIVIYMYILCQLNIEAGHVHWRE